MCISTSGHTQEQDLPAALELLQKAIDDMDNLADGVLQFANWWSRAETMTSTWEIRMRAIVGGMSRLRLGMAQKDWELVRNRYEDYKRIVSVLRLHPSIV
jgi:hypothetical protein